MRDRGVVYLCAAVLVAGGALVNPTAATAASGQVSTDTGNGLLALCRVEATEPLEAGMCAGYISGVSDVLAGLHAVCYSPQVTRGQIHDTVVLGLENNPATRDKAAFELATDYLLASFPCQKH